MPGRPARTVLRGPRRSNAPGLPDTNTGRGQPDFLEARHRAHARVEDRIRCGKTTGLDHLPSTMMTINQAWCVAATIACDLLCWLRLLYLGPALADAEPKTLRYRLLHTAAGSSAGNANAKSRSPSPGPGPTSWLPPSTPRSPCPHRPDHQHRPPSPTRGTPPARGTGAPDATVESTHTTHTPYEDHKRR